MSSAVVSPSPLASATGRDVLARGGSAIEACIAINAVLAVVCPHFCGLGGDAVWLVSDGEGTQSCLMGIGQGIEQGRVAGTIPARGPSSVLTTAAAVSSWGAALELSTTVLDLDELLAPAIAVAETGYPVSRSQVHWLAQRGEETAQWLGFDAQFRPDGTPPAAGDMLRQPNLARTMRDLSRNGLSAFYLGETAQGIVEGLNRHGVPMTAKDLAATATAIEQPLSLSYRGYTLLAPPPPTQGVTTLQIMGILAQMDLTRIEQDSVSHIHLVVEAVKQAFLDRHYIADPAFIDIDCEALLAPAHLAEMAAAIGTQVMAWPVPFNNADTVYFGAVDATGRCASVLQSTYFDWGSGVIAGDTGILWQNRGAAFSADPHHVNGFRPGKRPFYTLNPGMALQGGAPRLLYGTQGADGQPQTLAMLLTRLIDYDSTPEQALAGGRFLLGRTFSDNRDSLKLEGQFAPEVVDGLRHRGHEVTEIGAFSPLAGQAGVIRIGADGQVKGAHDPRGEGTALALPKAQT